MKNRKVKFNRTMPSEQQTAQYKNFDSVYGKFQKVQQSRGSFKNRSFYLGGMIIVLVALLVILSSQRENKSKKPTEQQKQVLNQL